MHRNPDECRDEHGNTHEKANREKPLICSFMNLCSGHERQFRLLIGML